MASLGDGSSEKVCSICWDMVLEDNSRGKAELICGHIFHLDCIGSEFNYRGKMKCPNCRVIEHGEWLLPDHELGDVPPSLDAENDYHEVHFYTQGGWTNNWVPNYPRRQFDDLEFLSPEVASNEVVPPALEGGTIEIYDDPLLRMLTYPTQRGRLEPVVLEARTNDGNVTTHYDTSPPVSNSPSMLIVDTSFDFSAQAVQDQPSEGESNEESRNQSRRMDGHLN